MAFRRHCVVGERTEARRMLVKEREVVRRRERLKLCWLKHCMCGFGTVWDGCYALVVHCEEWMKHPSLQLG